MAFGTYYDKNVVALNIIYIYNKKMFSISLNKQNFVVVELKMNKDVSYHFESQFFYDSCRL